MELVVPPDPVMSLSSDVETGFTEESEAQQAECNDEIRAAPS
jgi:hypothetical protein